MLPTDPSGRVTLYGRQFKSLAYPTLYNNVAWEADDAVLILNRRLVSHISLVESQHMYVLIRFCGRTVRLFELSVSDRVRKLRRMTIEESFRTLSTMSFKHSELPKILRRKASDAAYMRPGKFTTLDSMFAEMIMPWLRDLPHPVIRSADEVHRYYSSSGNSHLSLRMPSLKKMAHSMCKYSGDSMMAAIRKLSEDYEWHRSQNIAVGQVFSRIEDMEAPKITRLEPFVEILLRRLLLAEQMGSAEMAARMVDKPIGAADEQLSGTYEHLIRLLTTLHIEQSPLLKRVRLWIIKGNANDMTLLRDAYTSRSEYPNDIAWPRKPKTALAFHDEIVRQYNVVDDLKDNEPILYGQLALSLDGLISEGYVVYLAKSTAEIRRWGREMKHCIGSYAKRAKEGAIILGALIEPSPEGTCYNFEMDLTGTFAQVRGKCNALMPRSVEDAIQRHLLMHLDARDIRAGQDYDRLHRDKDLEVKHLQGLTQEAV